MKRWPRRGGSLGHRFGILANRARVRALSVTQVGYHTFYTNPRTGLSEPLHDRPPLLVRAIIDTSSGRSLLVSLIAVHLRSLTDIDDAVTARGCARSDGCRPSRWRPWRSRSSRRQGRWCSSWATSTRSTSTTATSMSSVPFGVRPRRPTRQSCRWPISSSPTWSIWGRAWRLPSGIVRVRGYGRVARPRLGVAGGRDARSTRGLRARVRRRAGGVEARHDALGAAVRPQSTRRHARGDPGVATRSAAVRRPSQVPSRLAESVLPCPPCRCSTGWCAASSSWSPARAGSARAS